MQKIFSNKVWSRLMVIQLFEVSNIVSLFCVRWRMDYVTIFLKIVLFFYRQLLHLVLGDWLHLGQLLDLQILAVLISCWFVRFTFLA